DSQSATAHGAHDGALHRTTKHHALLDLLRNAIRDELRIELRLANLRDIEAHIRTRHAEELRRLLAQLLDLFAFLTDDDAGAGGLNGDVHLLRGALDLHAADGSLGKLLLQEFAHAEIRVHMSRKLLLARVPLGHPIPGNTEANADRIDLLTHALILLP